MKNIFGCCQPLTYFRQVNKWTIEKTGISRNEQENSNTKTAVIQIYMI